LINFFIAFFLPTGEARVLSNASYLSRENSAGACGRQIALARP
jgi:hypothetical protein